MAIIGWQRVPGTSASSAISSSSLRVVGVIASDDHNSQSAHGDGVATDIAERSFGAEKSRADEHELSVDTRPGIPYGETECAKDAISHRISIHIVQASRLNTTHHASWTRPSLLLRPCTERSLGSCSSLSSAIPITLRSLRTILLDVRVVCRSSAASAVVESVLSIAEGACEETEFEGARGPSTALAPLAGI